MPDGLADIVAGGIAGAVAAALTTPLDVIVTHTATRASAGKKAAGVFEVHATPA